MLVSPQQCLMGHSTRRKRLRFNRSNERVVFTSLASVYIGTHQLPPCGLGVQHSRIQPAKRPQPPRVDLGECSLIVIPPATI